MNKAALTLAVACAALTPVLAAAGAMQPFTIVDPALNMPAWTLQIPVGWKADGTVQPPPSCSTGSTPVYEAHSPDRQMAAYFLPQVAWAYGGGAPRAADCAPFDGATTAEKFLTYQFAAEHIGYVATLPPEPAPPLAPGWTIQNARLLGRYVVRGREFDVVMSGGVMCHPVPMTPMHVCNGLVRRWDGPKGTVMRNIAMYDAIRLTVSPSWMEAWKRAMQRKVQGIYDAETAGLLRQGEIAGAARMREHQAFMGAQQVAADKRNLAFREHIYQKQRNSDNFVDYVLDCSRYYNQSGTSRISVGGNCPNRQTL